MWVTLAWLALVLVHAPPALATFLPSLRRRMYGVEDSGALSVILIHRGALFLAVAAACGFAAFEPTARTAAALVASISIAGFLIAYVAAASPKGPLRSIAFVDALALIPLAFVVADVAF